MQIKTSLLLALALTAPVAASADTRIGISLNLPGLVVIPSQPPEPRREMIPPPPGPDFVWVHGHWFWHHGEWRWMQGHYERRPYAQAVWMEGHWEQRPQGWAWIEGQWVVQQAPPAPPPPPPGYAPGQVYIPQQASVGPPVEQVYVEEAPPAPMYEAQPPPPGPGFFWIGGHWTWRHRWIWVGGRWDRSPRPGAVWIAGRWDHRDGRWLWVEGSWR